MTLRLIPRTPSQMRMCTLIALVLFVASPLVLAQTRGSYRITGAGTVSCGDFLTTVDEGGDSTQFAQWITGFLAGASWPEAKPGTRVDITIELDSAVPYLQRWCRENPGERVGHGAAALYNEIRQRALFDGIAKAIEQEERQNQRDRNATSR